MCDFSPYNEDIFAYGGDDDWEVLYVCRYCRRELSDPDSQSDLSVADTIRDCLTLADHEDHPNCNDHEKRWWFEEHDAEQDAVLNQCEDKPGPP